MQQDDENEEVMLGGREGHRNQPCVVVFILVYFFGNAASHWWTVATFTWCASLITSRKRLSASETVPKHRYFNTQGAERRGRGLPNYRNSVGHIVCVMKVMYTYLLFIKTPNEIT